jgi:hypothetical protein
MKIRVSLTQNLFTGSDIYFKKNWSRGNLEISIKLVFWDNPESKL